MTQSAKYIDHHRATYWLELGVWRGRCNLCGWEVADDNRRQAVAIFRRHIAQARAGALPPRLMIAATLPEDELPARSVG